MKRNRLTIQQGWLAQTKHSPSPNFNARPLISDISLIVIHNISLPPDQYGGGYITSFFQNTLDVQAHPYFQTIADQQVSAHVLIDRLGNMTQFVAFDDRAWHAGSSCYLGRPQCNDFSIGIELEGSDHEPFSDAQYQCLSQLVQLLHQHYPKTYRQVVGHSDIAPVRKTDPGPFFDWIRFREQAYGRSHLAADDVQTHGILYD